MQFSNVNFMVSCVWLLLLLHAVKSPLTDGDPMKEWPLQCPVLNSPTQLLQALKSSFRESTYVISGLPVSLLPSTFLSMTVFSRESWSRTTSASTFLPPEMVQAWFDLGSISVPAFWQSRLPQSSGPASHFKWVIFLLVSFLYYRAFTQYMVIGNMILWMIMALVSRYTSLHLVIFSSSFIAILQSPSLLFISWLQSTFGLMTEPRYSTFLTISISSLAALKLCSSSVVGLFVFLMHMALESSTKLGIVQYHFPDPLVLCCQTCFMSLHAQ